MKGWSAPQSSVTILDLEHEAEAMQLAQRMAALLDRVVTVRTADGLKVATFRPRKAATWVQ